MALFSAENITKTYGTGANSLPQAVVMAVKMGLLNTD